MINISKVYNTLIQGDLSILDTKNIININDYIMKFIKPNEKIIPTQDELENIHLILLMSNILWNNTDKDLLILDSGIYDLLLEFYKLYRPDDNTLVGAPPIRFDNYTEQIENMKSIVYEPIIFPDDTDKIFIQEIGRSPKYCREDFYIDGIVFESGYSARKQLNTTHNYPELVGTITKAKFVLNKQAKDAGVFDDPKVRIFERDFLGYHIKSGYISPDDNITLVVELKYDGVSVEADIKGDIIIGARSRGDTANDIAADLTSILYGYHFKHATGYIDSNYEFGMKFEAIMTQSNLKKFNELRGTNYKNCRTAISGLFNSKDGYKYRDFITLVPISTSVEGINRIDEIEFLNTYYHSGILMKYAIISGDYVNTLFELKTFVDEAQYMRDYLDFMYDGVVVEYIDEKLRETLGRKKAISQYTYAIKFDPQVKQARVTGLSYTVGKDGVITPMIHYTPVEFNGTVHDKSTLHSYARYLEERPAIGKIVDVTYINDVMPYATIPNNSYNSSIEDIIPYVDTCPSCGSKLVLSNSGKNWYCTNIGCRERNIRRMVDFLNIMNIKGWAFAILDKVNVYSFERLMNIQKSEVECLGPTNSINFMNIINDIYTRKSIEEHKIVGGLGFTSMSYTTWELILKQMTLRELLQIFHKDPHELYNRLLKIKGIGDVTAKTIIQEMPFFMNDIYTILSLKNVVPIKGSTDKPSVRFTNCRDSEFMEWLNNNGFDADDHKGVTKKTTYLMIPFKDFKGPSGKYDNAVANGVTQIMTIQELKDLVGYKEK